MAYRDPDADDPSDADLSRYSIPRKLAASPLTCHWDADAWRSVPGLRLEHAMGTPPRHRPVVQAKLGYDDEALEVIFRVEDCYVRAVAREHQDAVYEDSCVEFFFTPGADVSTGYFNVEMNCGGICLFHFQQRPREGSVVLPPASLARMTVAHQLPRQVDPELAEPTTWTVAYRLPFDLLAAHYPQPIAPPQVGTVWRANFFKCADASSHPHWLTWAPIDLPQPNFHVPRCFGTLIFQ